MAELSLNEALDALNAASAYLSPEAVEIYIAGDNDLVSVEWMTDAPDGPLHDFLVKVEVAAEVVTSVMGEGPDALLRLKLQVQHPRPTGHRMLRWTDEASTSAARNVA